MGKISNFIKTPLTEVPISGYVAGSLIGAGIGGAAGAFIDDNNRGQGAMLGALAGGTFGAGSIYSQLRRAKSLTK